MKRSRIQHWIQRLEKERSTDGTWAEAIRRDRTTAVTLPGFAEETKPIRDEVFYRVSYQGYLAREERHIEKMSHVEKIRIPQSLIYMSVKGLRRESAVKLTEAKPLTLGQASRISGVNPADISVLMVLIEAMRDPS